MTKLEWLGNSDNFYLSGVETFLQVPEKRSQATRKKIVYLHSDGSAIFHSKSLGVTSPVCLVNKTKILSLSEFE